jgi:lipid-A-disaccharide synthase-like uncharacterized protein
LLGNEGFLQPLLGAYLPWFYRDSLSWTAIGLVGNLLFSSRFVVQWLLSERRRRVVVPPLFWHLSLWGSVVALVYSLHIDKLPVILGYFFLPVVYARNLVLLRRESRAVRDAERVAVDGGHANTPAGPRRLVAAPPPRSRRRAG